MCYRRLIVFLLPWLLASPAAWGQHLDLRQQWQPQTENDPRLAQRVQMEILGRAVVTGLPLLSEKTGVLLDVAPEDRETLGERKFTLLAQGCELKSIMVQLCEALQECHWDVDLSGKETAYLLHREAEGENAALKREAEKAAEREAEQRAAREERIAAARAALKMTPEELAELEKTEVLLARAVRDPVMRAEMEALLSLPSETVQSWRYDQAPEAVRKAAAGVVEAHSAWLRRDPRMLPDWWHPELREPDRAAAPMEELARWREHAARITVTFEDQGCDFGFGVRLMVKLPIGKGAFTFSDAALPPRFISTDEGSWAYDRMLQATGSANHDAAWEVIRQTERAGFQRNREETEANRKAARVTPTDPALLKVVKAEKEGMELTAVQQSLAAQTGLSVVSDYFTGRRARVTEEMVGGLPLWEFLYELGEGWQGPLSYVWKKTGSFLVFHDDNWYRLAEQEVPESLLQSYQAKLEEQGRLTLDDLAGFAAALGERRPNFFSSYPRELALAGLGNVAAAKRGLLLYASLSPEQQTKARGEGGLPYKEMTIYQRSLIAGMARRIGPTKVSPEQVRSASFRIVEKTTERKVGETTRGTTTVEFHVPFGDVPYGEVVFMRYTVPAAAATGSGKEK